MGAKLSEGIETSDGRRNIGETMEFQPWQCISLVKHNSAVTFDLVVKDVDNMMILLSFLNRVVSRRRRISTMLPYLQLKFKMKLSYEMWQGKIPLKIHIIKAI